MNALIASARTRSPIGLDVGTDGARAVQLKRRGDSRTVRTVAMRDWAASETESARASQDLGRRLRNLLEQSSFQGRRVVTALNPPTVAFHALELPPTVFKDKGADINEVVRWEMERLVTDDFDSVETRHWPLPKTQASPSTAIGVAAKRDAVLNSVAQCREAGLRCVSVDAGASALSRFGAKLERWTSEQVWGVLDLGATETRMVVCVNDVPVLVRRGGTGGHFWTQRIAESLELSHQAVDVQKREHGITLSARGVRHDATGPPEREVSSILLGILRSELRELASEIKRSYEYVLSCYPSRHAADLVLVGGGAAMKNLPEFLGDALGITVRRSSEYLKMPGCCFRSGSGAADRFDALASAIGLAIER